MSTDCLTNSNPAGSIKETQVAPAELRRATADPPKRSIALFSGYYPCHGGGIELVCADLVESLCDRGYFVRWTAIQGMPTEHQERCAVYPVAGCDFLYKTLGIPFPLVSPLAFRGIWREIRKADVVLIAEANFMISVLAFAMAKLIGRPILLVQHVGAPSTVSRVAAAVMRIAEVLFVRPALRFADQVVYVSPAIRAYFSELELRREPHVVGHGIDTDLFRPATGEAEIWRERQFFALDRERPVACFAGRCTASKGIEVFMRLAKLCPEWQFVVAGTGPIDPLEGAGSNLRALGHIERASLARLYRAADVLVLPSPSESFSLVVREAMAASIGVLCDEQILETDPKLRNFVVTRTVELSHIESTAQAFAAALPQAQLSRNPEARSYVLEHCSWKHIGARYEALLLELP